MKINKIKYENTPCGMFFLTLPMIFSYIKAHNKSELKG
jgi:hypothetical protein